MRCAIAMREDRMAQSHYYVMFDKDGWRIQCDGENSDPYPRKRDAFRDAVGLAHLDDRNGRQAHVIVQSEDEVFRSEWDSRRDSYPPPLVPES
jgi:hypothetical protein